MEYQRRDGCSNLGGAYEYLMTALFSLRCALSKNVEEFWIAINATSVGDCDDIVLSIKSTTEVKFAFLIQLKHMETKNKLQSEQFLHSRELNKKTKKNKKQKREKDKFSLAKYWEGFKTFQEHLDNPKEDNDFIKELRNADKTILIMYTNRGAEDCNFFKQFDLSDNFFDLLGTNNAKHCYGFDHSQLPNHMSGWEQFLQRFYLFASQIHAEDVINVMETEIHNYFNLTASWMVNFQEVVKEYLDHVKTWIKGYKIGKNRKFYAITKPDVLRTLVGIVLNKYKYDFSTKAFTSYEDPTKKIWNEIISDKDVILLNNNEKVVQFIQSYYGSALLSSIQKIPTVWNTTLSKNAQKTFYDTFGRVRVAQVCHNVKLSITQIYKIFWMHGLVPLLIQLEDSKYFKDVLKMLKVCEHSIKVIVLVEDSSKEDFKKHTGRNFNTFRDLDSEQQKKVLDVEVNFQGRVSLPLNKLVDETMYGIIKCHDVINILSKEFIVGNNIEKRLEHFINRSMSRVLLRYEVLGLLNETFLIEAQDTEVARDRLKEYIEKPSLVHFIKKNELPQEQIFVGRPIHRLHYNDENFEWKESVSNIANLRNFILSPHEHKNSYELILPENLKTLFRDNSMNKTRILSAGPGMGKSAMMDFVARFAPEDVWVLNIKLNLRVFHENSTVKAKSSRKTNISPIYSDSDISDVSSDDDDMFDNAFDAAKFFEKLLTNDQYIYAREISLAVFRKFHRANKILILLDGFDEISIDYKKKVTEMIQLLQRKQHAVWVTTRGHMKTHLEDSLSTLASTLKPFTLAEQQSFLIHYFNANIVAPNKPIVVEFADRLLNAAAKNLSVRDGEFTGIPLQLKLIADVFLSKCETSCKNNVVKFNERFDLLKLYNKFIRQKNEILIEKFGPNEKTWSTSENLVNAQKYFALRTVFGIHALKSLDVDAKLADHFETVGRQLIQRGGILVVRESKKGIVIDFIHRTFAEYLAAQYLSENISNDNDLIRTNAMSLIEERYNAPNSYQFSFLVFDRIVAKNNTFHLSIINIKDDNLSFEIDKDPTLLLQCDVLKRNGLHMLALYGKEFTKEILKKILKRIQTFKYNQLGVPDLLGYTALDCCFRFHNWIVAHYLCKAEPYLPLRLCNNEDLEDLRSEFVIKTIFHNYCTAFLLYGTISENDQIDQCWNCISKSSRIYADQFGTLFKLNIATVGEYFELVGMKETNANIYYDIRLAVTHGTIHNVKHLLDSTDADINRKDCNRATLVHYAIYNHRYDILEELLHRGGDLHISDGIGNTAIHMLASNGAFELLLKVWGNIVGYEAKNEDGETPLDVAVKVNQFRTKKYFIHNYDQINESQKVYIAALLGDNEFLLQLLANESHINHQLDTKNKALYAALVHNHIDTANLLINHNIDFSLPMNFRESFLHLVARVGNQQLFETLLSKGLNIDGLNEFGETPLILAINHGHAELAEFIISRGADVSIVSKYQTALTQAIRVFDKETLICAILDKGYDINQINYGTTAIILAVQLEKPNIAKLLSKRTPCPDVTIPDSMGDTPLHYAAANGYADLVIDFLDQGISVDAQNKHNETPLLLALRKNNFEVAEILLNCNANVVLENNNGFTPLHHAAVFGPSNIILKILDKGGDVNKLNKENLTPLLWALDNSNFEAANLLLKHGADLTKGHYFGNSSLHAAAKTGNNEIVQKCLNLKMDVNIKNSFQQSPLSLAVIRSMVETAQLLIDNGADVFQTGCHNNTILHYASGINHKEFMLQMLELSVDVNAVNDYGETPLCIAANNKHICSTKLLLSHGAKLDNVAKNGRNILHFAASSNFHTLLLKCVNLNIFDINLEDNRGLSALASAIEFKSLTCAMLLLKRGAHDIESEEELTFLLGLAKDLVGRCNNLNELDGHKNTLLINIFTKVLSSSLNNFDLMWFCKVSNLLLDSGADKEIKGYANRSANDMFQDAFEDANAMNDAQREVCLKMGLVSRLNGSMAHRRAVRWRSRWCCLTS